MLQYILSAPIAGYRLWGAFILLLFSKALFCFGLLHCPCRPHFVIFTGQGTMAESFITDVDKFSVKIILYGDICHICPDTLKTFPFQAIHAMFSVAVCYPNHLYELAFQFTSRVQDYQIASYSCFTLTFRSSVAVSPSIWLVRL